MRKLFYATIHYVAHQIHEATYRIRARAELRLLELTIAQESDR
jgi:hypothetical protein